MSHYQSKGVKMLDWVLSGIPLIKWIQSYSHPVLDKFFLVMTTLGGEKFFLLSLPLFWSFWNRKKVFKFSFFLLATLLCVSILKECFQLPRPFEVDTTLKTFVTRHGYGLPSGHSAGSLVFWGMLATYYSHLACRAFFLFMILAISFSRLYFGVHFPADVFAGWLVGASFLVFFIFYDHKLEVSVNTRRFFILFWTILSLVLSTTLDGDSVAAWGAMSGLLAMHMWSREPGFNKKQKWICFFLALLGLVVLYISLKWAFLAMTGGKPHMSMRMLRYFLLGVWLSGGVQRITLWVTGTRLHKS